MEKEKQIIRNAIEKHNMLLDIEDQNILELVRYSLLIGYQEGYSDCAKEERI